LDAVIDPGQYSVFVATVIASAVIPTVIANACHLPRHLLPDAEIGYTPANSREQSRSGRWAEKQNDLGGRLARTGRIGPCQPAATNCGGLGS
jgi:hypothetical protein